MGHRNVDGRSVPLDGTAPAIEPQRASPWTRARRWAVPAGLVFMLAFPFPHFEFLRSPNELSRLYQVRALVDDHSLAVNAQVARFGPMGDLSEVDGRLYPNKAPGISFLGAPVYAALKLVAGDVANRTLLMWLRWLCCALPTLLLLRPLRRYAARVSGDARAAEAAALTYVFGTLALPYSLLYFSHQLSAVLAIGSFLALERAKASIHAPPLRLLAGFLAGYAVMCEYTLAPIAAMLFVYGVATSSRMFEAAAFIAAGALPCAVGLGIYHQAAYGNPFATGYAHVQSQTFAGWHAQGFMGVAMPKLSSLAGNLFSLSRGLFAFSPALAVAIWGLRAQGRETLDDALLALSVLIFYLFLASAFLYEAWGWMLGPRHLTPLAPFLVAPLACALALVRRRAPRAASWNLLAGAVAGLCAASILVNGLCAAVFPHVPEEFTAAMAHLAWPLASSGHLPSNLIEALAGPISAWTWTPWLVGLGAMAWAAFARVVERPRWWPSLLTGAAVITAFVGLSFVAAPAPSAREQKTLEWIERSWEPRR